MNSWKVILATMVIFGAGVVTGNLMVRYSEPVRHAPQPHPPTAFRPNQPPSPNGLKLELLRRVERDLDLQPSQRERVDKILGASQERTKRIMEPVMPRLREELQQTKDEFRAVLSPEQQKRFDEMLKQKLPRDGQRRPGNPMPRDRFPDGASYLPLSNEPALGK